MSSLRRSNVSTTFDTDKVSDRLFSQLSLKCITAINHREKVRLQRVFRGIECARYNCVMRLQRDSAQMKRRRDTLQGRLLPKTTDTEPSASDNDRQRRRNTVQDRLLLKTTDTEPTASENDRQRRRNTVHDQLLPKTTDTEPTASENDRQRRKNTVQDRVLPKTREMTSDISPTATSTLRDRATMRDAREISSAENVQKSDVFESQRATDVTSCHGLTEQTTTTSRARLDRSLTWQEVSRAETPFRLPHISRMLPVPQGRWSRHEPVSSAPVDDDTWQPDISECRYIRRVPRNYP